MNIRFFVDRFKNQGFFKKALGNFIISGLSTLISFGTTAILAKGMGSEQYGIYSYIFELINVIAIPTQFGLPPLVVRETAKNLRQENWENIKGLWQWSRKIILIFSVITISILLLLTVTPFSPYAGYMGIVVWGAMLIPLISLFSMNGAALRGLHLVIKGQLPKFIIFPTLYITLIIIYISFGNNPITPSRAMALQFVAALITWISSEILHHRTVLENISTASPVQTAKVWLKSLFSLTLFSGMNVLSKKVSILSLGLLVSVSEIGVFKVANQMAELADFGTRVVSPVLAPEITRLYTQKDHAQLQKLATYSSRFITLINIVIASAFIVLGPLFLDLFFGVEYAGAYDILIVLLLGQIVNSLTGAVVIFLNMTGFEQVTTRARSIFLLLTIIFIFLLTPNWGLMGTAAGISVASIIWNAMLWREAYRHLKINCLPFGIRALESEQ